MRVLLVIVFAFALIQGGVWGPSTALAGDTIGGVEPISPQEFAGKLGSLGDSAYEAASPLVDALAKLGIGASAVLLILVLIVGRTLIARVVGGLLTIALGVILWYGAPYIVAMVKGVWLWLTLH